MKFVEILTDTRTPYGPFYLGETRKVEPEVAGFLVGNGWGRDVEVSADAGTPDEDISPVTLDVQNANLGVNAEDVASG